ncbi:MAG: site-specific integrase [Ruminococcus flavefaciens]|nr:site-specific integrase [Ruminococcus flavefaciens]
MSRKGSNIYKRKDGRYEGRVPVGYRENGSLKYKSVYARTLSEVKEKMTQFYSVRQEQTVSSLKLTVREAAEQWLCSAKLRVKESSFANYSNIVIKHILPTLGGEYFSGLTTQKLNNFVHSKLKSGRLDGRGGLSAKTVRDIMRVYHSIEQYAVQEYGVKSTHFTMPKVEGKQLDVLNSIERKRLEQYLLNNLTNTNLAILLCLFTGLRVGELCGLTWDDIDFSTGTLSVKRTVQRINRHGSSEVIMGSPKSKTSVRTVPIPAFLLKLLSQNKKDDTLFLISGTAKPVEPRTMQYRFKTVLKACQVRNIPFHLLRHTYATVCIENGFDAKTLSELLGHADASITLNRYVHSSMQMKQNYVSRLCLSA